MKPQVKQVETAPATSKTSSGQRVVAADEDLDLRDLSLDELAEVGGGGIKDHSV